MSHLRAAVVVGFLAAGFWPAVAPGVAVALAAPPQADRDLQEVQSYRLSMDVVRKLAVVYKAAAAAEAKDPRRQQIARKKAELEALESKEEPELGHDSSTNALIQRYRKLKASGA